MCPWLHTVSGVLQPPGSGIAHDPVLTRLHGGADAIIIGVLIVTALTLFFLVLKRRELPFARVVGLFAAFLLFLAGLHLLSATTIADLDPLSAGLIKAAVAAAGGLAVLGLLLILPGALRLPTLEDARRLQAAADERGRVRTAELTAANERLAAEIRQREAAEDEVRRLNASLENRVSDLQTLFEFIPIGVGIAKDTECSVIQMNPALAIILNLPPTANTSLGEVSSDAAQNFKVFRRGVPLETHQLPMQIAARENQPVLDFEMSIVRDDGLTLDVLVSAVPLRDRTGHARGCVATFQDITQRKRSEQERLEFERRIQETQKLESLGVLSGGIAHDFNNLLTGVLGHANLARYSLVEGQTTVAQALDHIERSAQRAADLCKQLLAYAGKGRFHVQPLNLSRLVEEMSHLLNLSITQKASLELELANDLPPVMGDATQLRQVLMNLVINAAEAMPPGRGTGSITVRTSHVHATHDYLARAGFQDTVAEGGYLELDVSDNGVGMTPETQAKIFDPFFTTKFTGRGLGLAAVLGIVRSHKGTIRVYSELGRGTTFKLLFPTAPGTASAPPMPTPPTQDWRGSGTALVIDDEETVRNVARRALERLGFSVILATDGVEGLEKFRTSGPYSIVLLDLTMPRLDGEQTFRALRAADAQLPILLMSGFNEQSAVERFIGQGLAGFVPKPFTVDLLGRRVREAMSAARRVE